MTQYNRDRPSDFDLQRTKFSQPQTEKNPFIWIMPFLILLSVFHIYTNYTDYSLLQTVRGVDLSRLQQTIEKYSLPNAFVAEAKLETEVEALVEVYNEHSTRHKFYIGFYLALLVISLGLLWKDYIAIFATATFLIIVSIYGLMQGRIAYIEFTLFVWVLYHVLMAEKEKT